MNASNQCLDLIKKYEGLRLKPYLCPADLPTIGYGCTHYADGSKVTLKDPALTEVAANSLLACVVNERAKEVSALVKPALTQNMFDAIVSLTYNIGSKAFGNSTLLKLINEQDYPHAAQEFDRWVHSNGKRLEGLVKRRAEEKDLFLYQLHIQ